MKRLILALGLLLSLGLFGHGVAQAAPPSDCKLYITGGTGWPNGFFYQCSPQNDNYYASEAQGIYSVLSAQNNAYFVRQLATEGVPVYFYPSIGYFNQDFPNVTLPLPDAGYYNAMTQLTKAGAPTYSAVFEKLAGGALVDVQNASAHELGHWLDYYERAVLSSTTLASSSTLYQHSLTQDWKYFNSLPTCTPHNPNTGVTGIFYGEKDYSKSATGTYICANNGAGPGLASGYSGSNQAILQKIFQYIYPTSNNGEIFAEELAVVLGYKKLQISQPYPNLADWDHYMDSGVDIDLFACTQNVVSNLFFNGTKPLTFPTNCPSS